MSKIYKNLLIVVIILGLLASTQSLAQDEGIHPEGSLILDEDGQTVYLIENGKRRPFRDAEEFFTHDYTFDEVVAASNEDLELPVGELVLAASPSLIKLENDPTVWLVRDSRIIRPFPSMEVFDAWGLEEEKIHILQTLLGYHTGNPMPLP